jgi:hypothetical protein
MPITGDQAGRAIAPKVIPAPLDQNQDPIFKFNQIN